MSEVQIKNPPPAIFRWLTALAGSVVLIGAPAYGMKCIATQHVEQSPQNRRGRRSEGFELYGPAAVVFGVGFVGLGLSMGYALTFRFSRATSFKATRLDRTAVVVLLASIALLVVSQFLPTRTRYGAHRPDTVNLKSVSKPRSLTATLE